MLLCYYTLLMFAVVVLAAKDLYKLLGVNKGATDADIKRAFRKLAMKYHPDRNKEKGAEAKFREIAEAYEVLSDPQKRRQYDQFGDGSFNGGSSGSGGGGFHQGFNFDFDNFFKEFDASFKQRQQGGRPGGAGNRFKFGDGFFNFDDLWNDDEGIFGKNRGGSADQKQRAGGGSLFDFDFGDMFSGGSFFGSDLHNNHHKMHRAFHQQAHSNSQRSASASAGHGGQSGQTCRTVTQRFGNTVTTFTQCS